MMMMMMMIIIIIIIIIKIIMLKEVRRIGENEEENTKNISCKLWFVATSISNLVENLAKGTHKIQCKYLHHNKTCKTCATKYKCCQCSLEYRNVKYCLIKYKCLHCQKQFDEKLKKQFANTYTFSIYHINKFINKFVLLFWISVYPYEYMDDWENSIKDKEDMIPDKIRQNTWERRFLQPPKLS